MFMQKTIFLLFFLSIFSLAQAQHSTGFSCCTLHPSNEFAMLGKDEGFKSAHAEPLKKEFKGDTGENITFDCKDGMKANGFEIIQNKNSTKYLLVFHEWWGLNAYIKEEAEKLAKSLPDWNVIAVDLYDGKVANTREDAAALMQNLDPKRAENIIEGLKKKLGADTQIATIGWCMGGGWSLQAALAGGKQTVACVMYYGFPEKDLSKLKNLNSDVIFINATQDEWITKEVVDEFKTNMKQANKKLTVKDYNAPHAFANPSNPKYNKAYTEDAMKAVIAYISKSAK